MARGKGKRIVEALVKALRIRLKRESAHSPASLAEEIVAIGRRAAALPRLSHKTPEEIIGYDEHGLPR